MAERLREGAEDVTALILTEGQLATLYGWLDRYAPFSDAAADDSYAFVFSGSGREVAGAAARRDRGVDHRRGAPTGPDN